MSSAETEAVLKSVIILPFAFAAAFAAFGSNGRLRKLLAAVYASSAAALSLALLNGFLTSGSDASWGPFMLTGFSFPLLLVLQFACAAAVLYAGFQGSGDSGRGLLMACMLSGVGLASLALLSTGLMAQVLLWEGVTAAAFLGLVSAGAGGLGKKAKALAPWLLADGLLIAGAVLCLTALDESAVFIDPPLLSGSEEQVVAVAVLFLASAMIRLGVFPFHFWIRDALAVADSGWSALFLGPVNFTLAGFRLMVAVVFLGRLVVADWSAVLVAIGVLSLVAGPLIALRGDTVPEYIAGMYTMQAGALVAGLGLFSRPGLEGAILCLLVTPLFLTAALIASGTVESLRGTRSLDRQGLSARIAPAAFLALLISGMSMAGVPPLDGFVAKGTVILANLDGATLAPGGALAAGLAMAAMGAAVLALARVQGGIFAAGGSDITPLRRQSPVEGLAALALCGGSLLLGVFPGLLARNFVAPGSRLLFPGGFDGPGIAFKGTTDAAGKALAAYAGWSQVVAAFLLLAALIALSLYFISRAASPSEGPGNRFEPFLGGVQGEYGYSGRQSPRLRVPRLPVWRRGR